MKKIIVIPLLIVFIAAALYLFFRQDKLLENEFFVVERHDLIQGISVVGKVKPAEAVNLAFEKTGVLTKISVKTGQKVEKGTLLAQIGTAEAEKKVKDAEVSLENSKVALAKINLQKEQLLRGDTLNKNYEDGLTILSSLYDETAAILDSLDSILFGKDLESNKKNIEYYADYDEKFSSFPDRITKLHADAEKLQTEGLVDYYLAQRGGGQTREEAIRSGHNLTLKLAEIIKLSKDVVRNLQNFLIKENLVHQKASIIDGHASLLSQYDTSISNYLESLLNIINGINDYNDQLESLLLDIKTNELLIQQRENELTDARNNLAKHFLRSPIDAVVSKLNLEQGEIVTANSSFIEVTSASQFEIEADIYEEDINKIKVGSPVEISLPAFPGQVFQGRVFFIEQAEKIVEGVVYYETKIAFEENPPEGIKPTMTADLILEIAKKENVLVVPREAIQRIQGKTIAEVLEEGTPKEREVRIGLEGDDSVEIISGLQEGEKVLLR